MKPVRYLAASVALGLGATVAAAATTDPPAAVILFIGDGMGTGQVAAARAFLGRPLCFEAFPFAACIATAPAEGGITDSSAASTAMATGRRTFNSVISRALPGDGADLPTALEFHRDHGRRTGLVTTSYLLDATPAAFGAHANTRTDYGGIASYYLATNGPDLLLGGGYLLESNAVAAAGFTVAHDRDTMAAAATSGVSRLAGVFGASTMPYEVDGYGSLPHLREMTDAALRFLGRDGAPFFLMIEGGKIDLACHGQSILYCVHEMLEFERAVDVALAWAAGRQDVLILIAADHETGGLQVVADNGPGVLPTVTWSSTYHTDAPVRVHATGAGANRIVWSEHLADLHGILVEPAFPPPAVRTLNVAPGVGGLALSWTALSGRVYRVESAAGPGDAAWTEVGVVTSAVNEMLSRPLPAPDGAPRFYRVTGDPPWVP